MLAVLEDLRSGVMQRARARLVEIETNKARYDSDLATFAADCLTIRPKVGGETLLRFNPVQRYVDAKIENQLRRTGKVRKLILKARKPGVSTYVEARFYHKVSRKPGLRAFIMTHEQDATNTIFDMTSRFHQNNPQAPRTGASNAKELSFSEIDSGFIVGTAGSKGIGRGDTPQFFHGSEVAHWPNAAAHAAGILQSIPDVAGTEIILESTANGAMGLFYNMCRSAMAGVGDYELIFIPWFQHEEYSNPAPDGWHPPLKFVEYADLHEVNKNQLYWAYMKNADLAAADGDPTDDLCWRFQQEYPATAEEAFRASRKGSFISAADVARARKFKAPDQSHAGIILGCDFATGGDQEGGDANVFIDRQARVAGKHVYDRFHDGNTVSVANRLAAVIDRVKPLWTFLDTGGGGAAVYDILTDRNYKRMTLVNFGSKATDDRKYANKRAEMWGGMRDWLQDPGGADIPDEDMLDAELTSPKGKEDMNQRVMLRKKAEIRKEVGFSPDGGDGLGLTFAETVHEIDMSKINPLGRGRRGGVGSWMRA